MSFRLYGTACFAIFFAIQNALALQVTPGSPCAAYCLDDRSADPFSTKSSTTDTSGIVCKELHFENTNAGQKFRDCTRCLKDSDFVNGTESDLGWLLYNLRFAVDTCLFASSQEVLPLLQLNSSCSTASTCGPIESSLGAIGDEDKLAYCDASKDGFNGNVDSCVSCLDKEPGSVYISNFVNILSATCKYKPENGGAAAAFVKSDLFSQEGISFEAPADESSSSGSQKDGSSASDEGLSTIHIVVIVVATASAFLLAAVLFVVYFLRQKKLAQRQLAFYRNEYEKSSHSSGTSEFEHPTGNGATAFDPSLGHPALQQNSTDSVAVSQYNRMQTFSVAPTTPKYAPSTRTTDTASVTDQLPAHPAYRPNVRSRESPPPPGSVASRSLRVPTPPPVGEDQYHHQPASPISPPPPSVRKKKASIIPAHLDLTMAHQLTPAVLNSARTNPKSAGSAVLPLSGRAPSSRGGGGGLRSPPPSAYSIGTQMSPGLWSPALQSPPLPQQQRRQQDQGRGNGELTRLHNVSTHSLVSSSSRQHQHFRQQQQQQQPLPLNSPMSVRSFASATTGRGAPSPGLVSPAFSTTSWRSRNGAPSPRSILNGHGHRRTAGQQSFRDDVSTISGRIGRKMSRRDKWHREPATPMDISSPVHEAGPGLLGTPGHGQTQFARDVPAHEWDKGMLSPEMPMTPSSAVWQ